MRFIKFKSGIITLVIVSVLIISSLCYLSLLIDTEMQANAEDTTYENNLYTISASSEPIWLHTYNGPNQGDSQFESVYQLSNGDLAASGSQMTSTNLDWFTIRTSENGGGVDDGQQWTDTRGSSSSEKAFSVTQARVGDDIIVAGYYMNDGEDFSLKRLDSTGTSVWTRTFSEPYNQRPYQIISCSGGGFAIVGSYQFTLGAPPNAFILRTFDTGYEDWRADFGAAAADEAFSVVQCSNGDFVLAGYTRSYGGADKDLWVIRIDSTGTEIWNQVYGLSFDDWGEEIIQCRDGGFAIVGTTRSYGGSDQDVWLVRLNSTGHLLWHRFYGGVLDDYGKSIVECDKGYALTGTTESYGSGSGDVVLIRTDDVGNLLWRNEYGGSKVDNGYSITKCLDGGFVIAGGSRSWGGNDNDAFLMKVADSPVWLVEPVDQDIEYGVAFYYDLDATATYIDKWWVDDELQFSIDSEGIITNDVVLPVGDHNLQISVNDTLGNILTKSIIVSVTYTPSIHAWDALWQRTFGGTDDDKGISIIECANGDLAIGGFENSHGAGSYDGWLGRYDTFGNLLWNKTYGGASDDRVHSIVECADGDFVLAGTSASVNASYGYQAWVFRTDSTGTVEWEFNLGGLYKENATSITQTSDGGFVVTGYTSTALLEKDLILFKVNETGHLEWFATNVDSYDQEGLSVIEFSSGDIYVAGYDASGSAASTRRGLVFSTDSDGSNPNATTYSASAQNEFWDILQTGTSLVVTGTLEVSGNLDVYWAFITEITMEISYDDYFGGTSNDYGVSIIEETNGDFVISGNTRSLGVEGVGGIIIRISSAGTLEWYHTYGGAGNDFATDIIHFKNGGYMFVGYSDSIGSGSYDIWLARVQPVQWGKIPENQVIEYEQGISYDFTVHISPSVSLDDYSLNDTEFFVLNDRSGNFTLANSSVTPAGYYDLQLWVNDTNGEFLNMTFRIIVEASMAPVYTESPTDQIAEFGLQFSYKLNATDTAGIDTWWLNDTTRFSVDSAGLITNATKLMIGVYGIQLIVTDILGNSRVSDFDINVMDTTPPTWLNTPEDVYLIHGEELDYNISAWDYSEIDLWWVNDTANFNTTQTGIITSLHILDVGIYGLEINVNDTEGQLATTEITVFVQINPPIWILTPSNRFAEYAQPFSYSLSAASIAGIDLWGLNDTSHFAISKLGVITNATNLNIGRYGVSVWVQDIWEQKISADFVITVGDSMAPTWVKAPTNQTIEYGKSLNVVFSAKDASNVSHWSIDNTTHFGITSLGRLVSLTTLPVGTYWVTVSVYDTWMNHRSERIPITVVESQAPTWSVVPEDQTVEFGSDFVYALHVYDYSGISSFTLSDDANFQIN
ncbi:MAG: hypothetical protein ACFFCX_12645, partial [Candidatus Sifarchaeia archaeon]